MKLNPFRKSKSKGEGNVGFVKARINKGKKLIDYDEHFGEKGTIAQIKQTALSVGKKNYLNETFEQSMSRLKMKDSDLKDAYKYQRNMFKFWSVAGFFALISIVVAIVIRSYTSTLPGLAFVLVAISICYQTSYRCYCIKHRKLGVVDKWRKSSELIPKKYSDGSLSF